MARLTDNTKAAFIATAAAFVIIAFQIAAKSTRDALFLSNYDITVLPIMVMGASALSILVILATSRIMASLGPIKFVPLAFLTSAALLLVEWRILQQLPAVAAVLVYLHIAALGAVLISAFWSTVNERFDPRTAKKQMGRIAGGGALGGLIGGLLAERIGASLNLSLMLPVLSMLHLACAGLMVGLRPSVATADSSDEVNPEDDLDIGMSSFHLVARVPYLQNLALLVFLSTVSATLIDYVFKARTVAAYDQGEELIRFFAVFYTATGVLTFLVQISLSRLSLEKLGLGKTVGMHPATLGVGALGALLFPGLMSAGIARGSESILRSSLFRSAYELFFTPVPPGEKRRTKSIIDVGFDRFGDVVGGAAVRYILMVVPQMGHSIILGLGILSASAGLWVANRLQRGYVGEKSPGPSRSTGSVRCGGPNDSGYHDAHYGCIGLEPDFREIARCFDPGNGGFGGSRPCGWRICGFRNEQGLPPHCRPPVERLASDQGSSQPTRVVEFESAATLATTAGLGCDLTRCDTSFDES